MRVTSSRWIKKDREGYKPQQSKMWGTSDRLPPLKDQDFVVLGMNMQKENPSQKWDYEQSEQVSKRRERGDRVMVKQTSYYTLSKLLTPCTVIFVNGWKRGSHSNAKEVFMSTYGTQSWQKNQLQNSAIVMMVTLSTRLHRKLYESSVPCVSQRLLVHARSWLGSDLHSSLFFEWRANEKNHPRYVVLRDF